MEPNGLEPAVALGSWRASEGGARVCQPDPENSTSGPQQRAWAKSLSVACSEMAPIQRLGPALLLLVASVADSAPVRGIDATGPGASETKRIASRPKPPAWPSAFEARRERFDRCKTGGSKGQQQQQQQQQQQEEEDQQQEEYQQEEHQHQVRTLRVRSCARPWPQMSYVISLPYTKSVQPVALSYPVHVWCVWMRRCRPWGAIWRCRACATSGQSPEAQWRCGGRGFLRSQTPALPARAQVQRNGAVAPRVVLQRFGRDLRGPGGPVLGTRRRLSEAPCVVC